MSFSSNVKEELAKQIPGARHCRIAELLGIIEMVGDVTRYHTPACKLELLTENEVVRRKCFTLMRKTFNIRTVFFVSEDEDERSVIVEMGENANHILDTLHWDAQESICGEILKRDCCRRAYLRGAFLAAGSITNPDKFYHFEIVTDRLELARKLQEIMQLLTVESKIVERKNHYVVYVKEGDRIVDLLGLMEAGVSLMELENVRILKEMRGSVNRQVNCETANLNKTVNAAVRQYEDILLIREKLGLENLPAPLKEIAEARIANREASLVEIGEMMTPRIGKSGVNHRFRKLSQIAEVLRDSREE